ncbi:prepilin-type N-terminal cleavage/methylation domain-containing protein [Candidatus Sumerlaeota bacterium]|nr:prepilin-type N-terminal cleavage/methylation domain-containing protein [Candidatus Sumerlaeota bacterium]
MKKGFTLVEIMIVVAIIGILIAIAVPGFLRARENSRGQACQENLTKIDGAKEQWALEFKHSNGTQITDSAAFLADPNIFGLNGYVKKEPKCPSSGTYTVNNIGVDPTCSIGTDNGPFIDHTMPD